MGLSLEIYMEKIGRNLVCNSFYIESEVVANISGSNTIKQIKNCLLYTSPSPRD